MPPRPNTAAPSPSTTTPRHFAVVGAGMAGVTCARTLQQAGHRVTVLEQASTVGGRMAALSTPFGSFDLGAQYFTVRDERFERALQTVPETCRPWSASNIRVLDEEGRVAAISTPSGEAHWVARPTMASLVQIWAQPLAHSLHTGTQVTALVPDRVDSDRWELHTASGDGARKVFAGLDAVLLALPGAQAQVLLAGHAPAADMAQALDPIEMASSWVLTLAYPNAVQPGLTTLGPQWSAARSTHHRIAWLARESSKPGRSQIERWTVQASPAWTAKHLHDESTRIRAKLCKAFAQITGIHAEPAYAQVHLWQHGRTLQALGESHLWDPKLRLGVCGDWCLGHRVEDAFLSGLQLALAVA